MNAGELKALLEPIPDDAEVLVSDSEYGAGEAVVDVDQFRTARIRTKHAAGTRRYQVHDIPTEAMRDLFGWVPAPVYREEHVPEVVTEEEVTLRLGEYFDRQLAAHTTTTQDWEGRTVTRELLEVSEPFYRVDITSG